jgi:hypothetical protein
LEPLGFGVKPLFGLVSVVKDSTLADQVSVVKDSTLAIRRGDHSDLPLAFIFEEVDPSFAAELLLNKVQICYD